MSAEIPTPYPEVITLLSLCTLCHGHRVAVYLTGVPLVAVSTRNEWLCFMFQY